MLNKKKLVVIGGPTASGKTKVSIELAKKINGEIISADSIQVYKYMDIGSAKPTNEEKQGIPHYLIDELYPDEQFNVTVFKEKAKKYIEDIYSRGNIPILVGGTGFYTQSVVKDIDFEDTQTDNELREKLQQEADEYGTEYLHNKLKQIDQVSAENIHANNVKRVIRAIEYYYQTGNKISEHNEAEKQKQSPYDVTFIVLTMDRENLYNRINQRIDKMVEEGLVQEVKKLLDMGYAKDLVSMQGLGYKEIVDYLEGSISLEEALYILKRDTRHFAKRQITWFKREKDAIWINVDEYKNECGYDIDKIVEKIIKTIYYK